ncbi:MAG: TrbC/VirB2 family protein [Pseudomonadota bacterium]
MSYEIKSAKPAIATLCVALALTALLASPAYAAGSGMPWEAPLQQVVDSITGPVARAAGVIAIVVVGIGIAFSEGGSGVRKLAYVGAGLTIAFWAATGIVSLFGFAGGAQI